MSKRSRTNELKVFLSDDEKFILDKKLELSGMHSRSAFIRHLIIHGYVYEINYDGLKALAEQVRKIGVNINQIVDRVRRTGSYYSDDINEIEELMRKVWHTLGSTLSKQPYIKR